MDTDLRSLDRELAGAGAARRYLAAYSGGVDSHVLLHLMHRWHELHPDVPLLALHVHHGMHPEADAWQAHCATVCADLGIPLVTRQVDVDVREGGPEAAARAARYAAFAALMEPGDVLLLAHHRRDQAETLLESNGLCSGRKSHLHHTAADAGTVAAQAPPAGRLVARGTCVDLLVSLGPRPGAVVMPRLDGLRLEDAVALLQGGGLTTGRIRYAVDRQKPPEVVIGQQPPAGYRAVLNSAVDLRISRRSAAARPTGGENQHLFRYRVSGGFLRQHIRVEWKTATLSTDLFDAYVAPGRELWLLVPSWHDGTLLLYRNGRLETVRFYPAG